MLISILKLVTLSSTMYMFRRFNVKFLKTFLPQVGIGEDMIQALYSDNVVEQEAATQKFRKLLSRGNYTK